LGWLRVPFWVYGSLKGVADHVAVVAVDVERQKVLYRATPPSTTSAAAHNGPSTGPEQEGDLSAFTPAPGQVWDF
jgi:hypothetical protein